MTAMRIIRSSSSGIRMMTMVMLMMIVVVCFGFRNLYVVQILNII